MVKYGILYIKCPKIHLNYPPCLEKLWEIISLKCPKMHNYPNMVGENYENYNFYYVNYDNMKLWRSVNENIFPDFIGLFHHIFQFSLTFTDFSEKDTFFTDFQDRMNTT